MKYIDKNLIIERYINGTMSPSEIQSFHTMLEADNELRSMFQAENIINSTVAKERYALEAMDHSQSYATFLKGLANSIPQAATATSAVGAGKAASWLAGIGTGVKVAASTAILAGAVAVGTFVMQPTPHNDVTPVLDAGQQRDIPVALPQPSSGNNENLREVEDKQASKLPAAAPAHTVKNNDNIHAQQQLRNSAQQQSSPAHTTLPQEKQADATTKKKDEGIQVINDPNLNISVQSDSAKK